MGKTVIKILKTIGLLALLVGGAFLAWHAFGRTLLSGVITQMKGTWKKAADDPVHPTVEKPLSDAEIDAELKKLDKTG